ncbi:MAG: aspartate aminotransferase family protein [Pseudomonadota bacterium]
MAQPVSEQWQALDAAHYLHPFTDHKALHKRQSRIIQRAEGVYIYDADGQEILDAMSGLWCVNAGYGREELVHAAAAQMRELPYYNSFFQCAHPPAVELAALLGDISPEGFNRVFFTSSGSEANDTVVRMVRTYWSALGQPKRQVIISRRNAYHGSTVAAASLGGMGDMHKQGGLPIPDIEHIDQPYWFGSDQQLSPEAFGKHAAEALEARIQAVGPERVAAFIGEPIQGAGGVIIPPDSYWPAIQETCRRHNILLVADEVITGFGRLGHWFGSQRFGIEPDLIPFAKGVTSGYLPLGGVLVGDRVGDALVEQAGEFAHGFTYSGHPAACAVAIANLKLIQREGLVERIREDIGPYLQERWARLADHPMVGETRMVGLMGALELVRQKAPPERFPKDNGAGAKCRDFCLKEGLVMRAVGDSMIVAPPFTLTHAEADKLINRARRALDQTWATLS